MAFTITSLAFAPNGKIPSLYTCEGDNISPPLEWTGVPMTTKSLVLIVDDPDAPDPAHPRMTWVHWMLYNLPPELSGLPAGVSVLPGTTVTGVNDWGRRDYGGPCPPIGRHRYFFKLYALDRLLDHLTPGSKDQIESAMRGHVLAATEIIGTYQKAGS